MLNYNYKLLNLLSASLPAFIHTFKHRSIMRFLLSLGLIGASARAYSNTLDACAEFAAIWSSSCGGTDEDAVYDSSTDWETTGAGKTTSSCSVANTDDDP